MKSIYILLFNLIILISCNTVKNDENEKLITNPNPPNIVIIVSDDHGSKDAGCYGNKAIKTPNIDLLASEGIKFNNAHCTSPSCSASRSVILTGLYNHAIGHYGHMHSYHHFSSYDHVKSLPVYLKEFGNYRTGRVGKYHLAPEAVYKFGEIFKANSRNSVAMADSVQAFIEDRDKRPFFLYYCTSDPHRGGGEVTAHPLKPNAFGNKKEGYPGIEKVTFNEADVIVPPYLPDRPETRAELAQYYESVHRMDQGVGRIIQHLKSTGKWDNTVIIYISDNGIAFPGAKTNIYQAGINLPCIVKNVNSEHKGSETDVFVSWADLTPTVLELAGVLTNAQQYIQSLYKEYGSENTNNIYAKAFHGDSFADVLNGNLDKEDREMFASHTFHEITMYYPMRSVVSGNFKLIWNIAHGLPYPHASDLYASATWQATLKSDDQLYAGRSVKDYTYRPQFELYNIKDDPYEIKNLINSVEHQETAKALMVKMKKYQQETNDPWVTKWIHE
ncbi:MAG: sulfatase [Bacteroidota bacterium]